MDSRPGTAAHCSHNPALEQWHLERGARSLTTLGFHHHYRATIRPVCHTQAALRGLGYAESSSRPDSVPGVSWHRPAAGLALAPIQRAVTARYLGGIPKLVRRRTSRLVAPRGSDER